MTSDPPVIPTTPLFTARGVDVYDDRLGGLWAYRGGRYAGSAFPVPAAEPDKDWFGRRQGETARRFPSRHAALAHVVGGCPECRCEPERCKADDSGTYCVEVGCGACLNGCPDDLCDMREDRR